MAAKTAEKTVAQVQGEIAALQQEQAQLRADLTQIEQAIADNWNGDNGESEASYALKQARLNASGRVMERLQGELKSATKSDKLKEYRQLVKEYLPIETAAQEAREKVKLLTDQLKAAQEDYREKQRIDDYSRARVHLGNPLPPQYREAGINSDAELNEIYNEEAQKYQQKLEKQEKKTA